MYWYGDHMSGWGWGLMTVSMLLFWGLAIAGVVLIVRHLRRDQRPASHPTGSAAEQLLAERFARGEIDEQEYRHRLDILRDKETPSPR